MKVMWYWRCKMEAPMLDGTEYAEIYKIYGDCFDAVKAAARVARAALGRAENKITTASNRSAMLISA